MAIFYTVKHTLTLCHSNSTLGYLLKNENICPQIDYHENVDSSFNHNGQKWETAQMSIKRMKKQIVVYLYNKLVLSPKGANDTLNNMAECQNHYNERKQQDRGK